MTSWSPFFSPGLRGYNAMDMTCPSVDPTEKARHSSPVFGSRTCGSCRTPVTDSLVTLTECACLPLCTSYSSMASTPSHTRTVPFLDAETNVPVPFRRHSLATDCPACSSGERRDDPAFHGANLWVLVHFRPASPLPMPPHDANDARLARFHMITTPMMSPAITRFFLPAIAPMLVSCSSRWTSLICAAFSSDEFSSPPSATDMSHMFIFLSFLDSVANEPEHSMISR
mmetsp:Transcript_49910/g.106139  ORF Transcript_49910/g.106139 Transcript_49910/m.106139 type:complete len:228 (-) Transcript_49910:469-1152(-)